jgi:hypothetical protein
LNVKLAAAVINMGAHMVEADGKEADAVDS